MSLIKYSKELCNPDNQKPRLVIIAGPTAVGKSAAAVRLAKKLNGEVISADSMQVYRGMDIGTAKVTREEMDGIPHHLIDCMDPHEDYNVVQFQQMAKAVLSDIYRRGKLPILCGGTGFYIQALLYDIDFTEEPQEEKRAQLEADFLSDARNAAAKQTARQILTSDAVQTLTSGAAQISLPDTEAAYLHARLQEVDPEAARLIPAENKKRVLRALVFYALHGMPISAHNRMQEARKENCPFDCRFFVLTDQRERLYARIDARVDQMMANGLLSEVRQLLEEGVKRESTAMQGIGYRELYAHLCGELSLEDAVEKIKQNSRHYAKRQLTWFRREKRVIWVDRSETEDIYDEILQHLW